MYAEMKISHGADGDPVAALRSALNDAPDCPAALNDMSHPGVAILAGEKVFSYTAVTASFIITSSTPLRGQIHLILEPRHDDLKRVCDDVWQAFRREAAPLRPRLDGLELRDPVARDPIARARTGRGLVLQRTEFQLAVGAAVITGVVIAAILAFGLVEGQTAELWMAAGPAFILGLMAVIIGLVTVMRRGLIWES